MKVKDIMVKDVETISADISAQEAMNILFSRKISGLPVVDGSGRLAGMFTEKDILSYILPSYIQQVGKFVYEEDPKASRKKFFQMRGIKVSQLMRKDVVTVTEEVGLCELARIMLTKKARRVPVLNKANNIVGIVAREDLLKAFNNEMGSAENAAAAPKEEG